MKDWQFKEGNSGRPVGAVNKVNKLIKDVVFDTFHDIQNDPDAKKKRADFFTWAKDNPKDFYLIASKLIGIQVTHEGNPLQPIIFKLDDKFTEDHKDNSSISKELSDFIK